MSEANFTKIIFEVAESLQRKPLEDAEKTKIIEEFNSNSGTAYERSKKAIETVIGKKIPSKFLMLEKAGSQNLLQALLAKLSAEAQAWQSKQK